MQYTSMKVSDPRMQDMARYFADGVAKFLKNITRYRRDANGAYPWAYTGEKILVKVGGDTIQKFYDILGGQGKDLILNSVRVGRLQIFNPYAYPQNFLVLWLDENFHYDTRVLFRFAKYGGLSLSYKDFNHCLLYIDTMEPMPALELIY